MERLKELRIQHGLLQKDVAIKLGVDRTTYVKYENGKSEPNHEILQKLADIFSTSTDYILGRTNEENHIMFSERLKKARKNAGITQEELAVRIGVERSSVGKYESTSTIPSPDVLIKIATELNVTTDYLLSGKIDDIAKNGIPVRLKELRSNKGISQAKLAKDLGVSVGAVGNWESGIRLPDAKTIHRIADYFNTTIDYLLGREEEKKTAQSELPLPGVIDAIISSCSTLSAEKLKVILDICRILNQEQDS